MFDITFLGTAASAPSIARNVSALLVEYDGHRFLIDCGEGTQRQILQAGLGFRRLDKVFLTHGHLDHILGLGGLAGTLNLLGAERLTVHAGRRPLELARRLLMEVVWADGPPAMVLDFVELRPGPLFSDGDLVVSAFPVRHRAPDCLGFLFERRPHRPLLRDRLEALGVPAGPERSRLSAGQAVQLADGRWIEPDMVLGPPIGGCRVAIVGDAESVDDLVEHVRGADLLVIEGTFLSRDEPLARARSHLTIADAARLAERAGVARLWLNHQSIRYAEGETEAELARLWPNGRIARDFDRVSVP